jgi:bacillithiol biosynthesis cysteine-adding enzyme BshC
METACLRHTEIPHTSRLFSDFQYHFDRVSRFYAHNPFDRSSYSAVAQKMAFPPDRRAQLVAALRAKNGNAPALDVLARSETVAVVTGHQVGLFSGPAYTIYKALSAARLAAELTERGIPAVPVFWLATEDHDFAEIDHTWVFDKDHRPVPIGVNSSGESERPVGTIPVTDPPVERLREILRAFPHSEEVVELVRQAYQPGVTFGAGFQALLERLLAKFGILYIDPLDEAVRRLAAPLLRNALQGGAKLNEKLLQRNKGLEAAGYHAQVHVEQKTSLVFLLEGARRIALRRQNGDYASKDRRYSVDDLVQLADHLSPNALLRPVVQDYILPTVAYVGGPAELAYMAQSQVLYEDLLGRMPVMLARSGFTLLDSRASKLIDRYKLTIASFFHGEDGVREQIAKTLIPETLLHEFKQSQQGLTKLLDHLRDGLVGFDATLAASADKSRAKILYQLAKLERKTARETLYRDQRATADASCLSGLIYPGKHLQERLYSILPFIANHGPGLMDTLYENIHLDCPDHKVLVV